MITIKSPNKTYNSSTYGVPFVNGVGHTDNAWLIQMFKEAGYVISDGDDVEPKEKNAETTLFDKMTITELRDFATENGIDLGKFSKKAEIIGAIVATQAEEEAVVETSVEVLGKE